MPPKKSAAASANATAAATPDADGSTKFTWEGANDFKLLLLTQGRHVKPDEHERLAVVFGDDISTGSIRNRISRLRGQQRALYELHGWAWPDVGTGGGGGGSAKKAGGGGGGGGGRAKAGKKRDADGGGDASGPVRKKGKVGGGKEAAKNEEEEGVVVQGEEGEGEGASMVDCKEEREEMEDEV